MPSDAAAPTSNAFVSTSPTMPYRGVAVGVPDGDGYRDIVVVKVADAAPDDADTPSQTVERVSGPVLVEDDGTVVRVVQPRGVHWLVSGGESDQQGLILDVLDQLEVDDEGGVTVTSDAPVEVIGVIENDLDGTRTGTYFELANGIVVETDVVASALAGLGAADRAAPIIVNGTAGWHVSRRDADGQWNGVVWMAAPHRMVAVSGHQPWATVRDAATDLVVASEEMWTARLDPQP